jgi:hypothetical protein
MGSGPLHPDQRYPTGNHSSGCFSRNWDLIKKSGYLELIVFHTKMLYYY